MFLLSRFEKYTRIIAIFGEGLIGSSILSALIASVKFANEVMEFSYEDDIKQLGALRDIAYRVSQIANKGPVDFCVVWAAGKAGFSAGERDVQAEIAIFRRILELAQNPVGLHPESKISFHLISSAGGLFEGQICVTHDSNPSAMRHYGQLKKNEEELLLSSSDRIAKRIYRLSSVYGHITTGHRRGLIPTLILNGVLQRVSHIYGNLNTLRDYVWCEDVGKHIARALSEDGSDKNCTINHLVSGKPSSVYEIQHVIEGLLSKKIYLAFRDTNANSRDITFSRTIFPDNWYPTDLETGARAVYLKWRDRGSIS